MFDQARADQAREIAAAGTEIARGLAIVMNAIDEVHGGLAATQLAVIHACISEAVTEHGFEHDGRARAIVGYLLALERPGGYPLKEGDRLRWKAETAVSDYSEIAPEDEEMERAGWRVG
jgi:hypothetical protein